MINFSIVICSFNKARLLRAVLLNLEHLLSSEKDSAFEVIVVVDGSTDGTMDILRRLKVNYDLRYFFIDNAGLSNARNFGIGHCQGSHVIFCDDDVLLHPFYLENLLSAVAQHPADVHIGNLINVDKCYVDQIIETVSTGNTLLSAGLDLPKSYHVFFEAAKQLFFYQEEFQPVVPAVWWAVVTGGNLCVPLAHFKDFGMFDTNISGWGPEDADLCYRFFKNGVRARYNDACLLYHLDHERDTVHILQTMTKNAVYFIKKYQKPPELYHYLNFTNSKLSLKEFNDLCSDIFGMQKVDVPRFFMSMKDYSGLEKILKHDA